jgi:hypothetical protein
MGQAPVFSSVTPASNSFVRVADVGYTLSEAITSGSVTFERTGGSSDSDRTIALAAAELNAGAFSGALTNAPSLVDGAIYTL